MLKYPGDLLVVENASYDGYNGYCADRKRYFTISNATEKGVEPYQKYDMTVWFNSVLYTNPKVKIVKLEPVITSLDAPTISGETSFEESTTVTINSDKTSPLSTIRPMVMSLRPDLPLIRARSL